MLYNTQVREYKINIFDGDSIPLYVPDENKIKYNIAHATHSHS